MLPALSSKPKQTPRQVNGLSDDSIDSYANTTGGITSTATYADNTTARSSRKAAVEKDDDVVIARVIRDRKPTGDEELALKIGDMVKVHSTKRTGYLKCEFNEEIGYVPSSYLEFFDDQGKGDDAVDGGDPSHSEKKKKKKKKKAVEEGSDFEEVSPTKSSRKSTVEPTHAADEDHGESSHKKKHKKHKKHRKHEEEEESAPVRKEGGGSDDESERKSRKSKKKKKRHDSSASSESEEGEPNHRHGRKHRHRHRRGRSRDSASESASASESSDSGSHRHRRRRRHHSSSGDSDGGKRRSRHRRHKHRDDSTSDGGDKDKKKKRNGDEDGSKSSRKKDREDKIEKSKEEIKEKEKEDKETSRKNKEEEESNSKNGKSKETTETKEKESKGFGKQIGDKMRSLLGGGKKTDRSSKNSSGILNACIGTVQGDEGWYEHGENERYYFILVDSKWSLLYGPMSEEDFEVYSHKVIEQGRSVDLPPTYLHRSGYQLNKDLRVVKV